MYLRWSSFAGGGEAAAGPTMMSREARALMLAGDGSAGLAAWKERWYTEKLRLRAGDAAARRAVAEAYLQVGGGPFACSGGTI